MYALEALLCECEKADSFRLYVADILWFCAKPQYKQFPIPLYSELAHDRQQDHRTAEDLKNDLLAKLVGEA